MRKTVHKFFWVWDYDKEEQWLNEMAAKGLALASVGFFRYDFEDCQPGEYKICFEMRDSLPNSPQTQKYIQFVEESGAEHVGNCARWIYFRKKDDPRFCLYSDIASRVKCLNRIIHFVGIISALNVFIGAENIVIALLRRSDMSDINLFGLINLALGTLGFIGLYKLVKKRKALKALGDIFE